MLVCSFYSSSKNHSVKLRQGMIMTTLALISAEEDLLLLGYIGF